MKTRFPILVTILCLALAARFCPAASGRTFPLVASGAAVDIVADPADFKVVQIAAADLAADVERVTGVKPAVKNPGGALSKNVVLIGTLGKSPLIEDLVKTKTLHVAQIRGQWESFVIAFVDAPLPGVDRALVIVGSDRRGTAFGVYELSSQIGVSPWVWWADVTPEHRDELLIPDAPQKFGPPSVTYRGIFINDEKFGLHPWAATTLEPENGGIGPKTYKKVFELLLRLKANTLWPAMKQCTRAFNSFDENKILADDYAMVMGSSHCEHLLRNNIDEWPRDGRGDWDYTTNRDNILAYWAARLKTNGAFENIYTLGMRGADDKEMPGGGTPDEQTARLSQIIKDQRELLTQYVNPDITQVPQILSPYKEVLDLYRNGLDLPDDVTILWTDDNYGYIRKLSNPDEQKRSGGSGVYYHISYSGNPHDYLWLDTTPPALMWYELKKAYDHGARTLWIANVGDIKPAEMGTELFLQLAWNMAPWESTPEQVHWIKTLQGLYWSDFHWFSLDPFFALFKHYELAAARKPEHMGYNERDLPNTTIQDPDFSLWNYGDEAEERMRAYRELAATAATVHQSLSQEKRDAFYQLVLYPVRSAALLNEKVLYAYKSREYARFGRVSANRYAELSQQAFEKIKAETEYYNKSLAGGKWDGVMDWKQHDRLVFYEIETKTVTPKPEADLMVMIEGQDKPTAPAGTATDNPRNVLPELTCIKGLNGYDTVFADLFNRGAKPVEWALETSAEWLRTDTRSGSFDEETRLRISPVCSKVPTGPSQATITITGTGRTYTIIAPVFKPEHMPEHLSFVQKNGVVFIPAGSFSVKQPDTGPAWKSLFGLGRTFNAMALFPTTMPPVTDPAKIKSEAPAAAYKLHIHRPGKARVIVQALPTHEIDEFHHLVTAVSVDGGEPVLIRFEQGNAEHDKAWRRNVLRGYMEGTADLEFSEGPHTLTLYGLDPSVAVDRIILDFGGLKPCNFGLMSTQYDPRESED